HLPRKERQRLFVTRQGVGLAVIKKLQAVLEIPQELIGRRQSRIFSAGEQVLAAQPEKREARSSVADPGLATAMQALHALHEEFNIADAAGAEFDVQPGIRRRSRLAWPRGELLADALTRLRHRLDGSEVGGRRINQRLDRVEQLAAEFAISGRHAGLDKHLQFPVTAAVAIVVARAVE